MEDCKCSCNSLIIRPHCVLCEVQSFLSDSRLTLNIFIIYLTYLNEYQFFPICGKKYIPDIGQDHQLSTSLETSSDNNPPPGTSHFEPMPLLCITSFLILNYRSIQHSSSGLKWRINKTSGMFTS